MKARQLIDPAARQRFETTITEAERHSAGEIVLVVTHACDEYGSAGWRFSEATDVVPLPPLFDPERDRRRFLLLPGLHVGC